jgi:hypothetical protein
MNENNKSYPLDMFELFRIQNMDATTLNISMSACELTQFKWKWSFKLNFCIQISDGDSNMACKSWFNVGIWTIIVYTYQILNSS